MRAALVLVAVCLAGCGGWLTSQHVADVAALVNCVVANDDAPVEKIVAVCGAENAQQVVDLLAAEKRAATKHRAAMCAEVK